MTNINEQVYLDLLKDVMLNGKESGDRTGTGTVRVVCRQLRFDLRESFPLITTKAVPWKGITSELLWFIEGSGDERRLAEIRYGKDRSELEGKTTIWSENAKAPYWVNRKNGSEDYFANGPDFEGDLGRVYGMQWRDWQSPRKGVPDGTQGLRLVESTDQLANLVENIKKDPNGRRHILNAWNAGELDQMALPPCHVLSQYIVLDGELYCHLFIRSWDLFLGASFNIASYSLLTLMIAQVCGLKPAELIISVTDAHIYLNHFDQVNEQLNRTPQSAPTVTLNPDIKSLFDFKMSDIVLNDYHPLEAIQASMAV